MPVLPPFLLSSCLDFRSSVLGAIVVASLDFWLNLGLSRLEKATRLSRLEFGRNIFEFGRPVVPDLTTVVGNCCFPASSGTTALPERYYRLEQYYRGYFRGYFRSGPKTRHKSSGGRHGCNFLVPLASSSTATLSSSTSTPSGSTVRTSGSTALCGL